LYKPSKSRVATGCGDATSEGTLSVIVPPSAPAIGAKDSIPRA